METDVGTGIDSIVKEDIDSSGPWFIYTTTVLILTVVHALYIYHVATKKERSSMVVSYNTLVQRKRFHQAILALLSHPPTKRAQRGDSQSILEMASLSFVVERLQEWQRSSVLCNGKRLSGLPLLLYNSFILWNCRELEATLGSYKYARLLWGIAVVSMLLDVWLTYYILSFLSEMNYGTSSPLSVISRSGQPSGGTERVKRMLVHRSMGSLTVVSTGVLTIFQHRFPSVPISILPLVNARHLFFVTPAVGYAFCLGILSFLSQSAHPFSGVICGAFAGLTWSSNLCSFLLEPYWANGTFFFYLLLCILSLKATKSSFVPCIDHKPWDSRGRLRETQEFYEQEVSFSSAQDDSSSNNDLFERGDDIEENLLPLSTGDDELRHLLPNVEALGNDFNQNDQEFDYLYHENATTPAPPSAGDSASNVDAGVRSRRTPRL